jgi:hypothetical protein
MDPIKPGSKYHPLYEHLRQLGEDQVRMDFQTLEQLIASRLPGSARAGKAFWSNRGQGALQAAAFARPRLRYQLQGSGGELLWDGQAVLALRRHMGLNQAGLAEVLGVRQQTVSEWESGTYAPTRARSKHLSLIAEKAAFPFRQD